MTKLYSIIYIYIAHSQSVLGANFLPKIRDRSFDIIHFIIKALRSIHSRIFHDHFRAVGHMEELFVIETTEINVLDIVVIEPLDALPIFPKTVLSLVFLRHEVGSEAMLLALPPVAFVASSISPGVDAEAMLLIVFVLAFVLSTVVPDVVALALHVVVHPFSFVLAPI